MGAALPTRPLTGIKLAHTGIWAVLAAAVVVATACALLGWTRPASLASAMVWVEVAVLAANRWKCPLTSVAERLTDERGDTFDIYLPAWLSRNNKLIFGGLFAVGQVALLIRCLA
jgi:hypothetical protein